MPQLELRRLRYFLAVAEELHFARAAERLNMAQPPLSEQIRKLEDEVGFKLFYRNSRNVTLTEGGRVLLAGARQAMLEIDRAMQAGRQTERGYAGHLKLGFVGSGNLTFMPKLLRRLGSELPNVRAEVRQFSSNGALEALAQRAIDLAIVRTPVAGEHIQHRPIHRDAVVLAIAEDHELAHRQGLRLADLSEENFVLYPPNKGHAAYNVAQRACLAAGFVPIAAQFVEDVYGMLALVAAGLGVALMPASMAQLNVSGVVFHSLPDVTERFELSLAWRTEDDRALVATAIETLASSDTLHL